MPAAAACASMLADKCAVEVMEAHVAPIIIGDGHPCKDEIKKHCQKQIDELKKVIFPAFPPRFLN